MWVSESACQTGAPDDPPEAGSGGEGHTDSREKFVSVLTALLFSGSSLWVWENRPGKPHGAVKMPAGS